MAIWGDFQGLSGMTRGGRGVKNLENLGDVIYGWSLMKSDQRKEKEKGFNYPFLKK